MLWVLLLFDTVNKCCWLLMLCPRSWNIPPFFNLVNYFWRHADFPVGRCKGCLRNGAGRTQLNQWACCGEWASCGFQPHTSPTARYALSTGEGSLDPLAAIGLGAVRCKKENLVRWSSLAALWVWLLAGCFLLKLSRWGSDLDSRCCCLQKWVCGNRGTYVWMDGHTCLTDSSALGVEDFFFIFVMRRQTFNKSLLLKMSCKAALTACVVYLALAV